MWHRLKPVLALVLLAPLIAEYLLGSLTFGQLGLFPIMALLYGAGALFVREIARRSGRDWPTILMLGLAFGLMEEGLATQSLFNPHYLGLHLLDYGFIPALGIGATWTAYVVILHAVWSIAVPIGLVEALFPDRRTTPWLGLPGFVGCGIFSGLGVMLIALGTRSREHFAASVTQLAVTAAVAVILVALALVMFRSRRTWPDNPQNRSNWRPASLGLLAFFAGSVFHLVIQSGRGHFSPWVAVILTGLLCASVIAAARTMMKAGDWTVAHTDALVLGALLVYCWLGFFLTFRLHGTGALPGQCFPCAIVLAVVYGRFVRRRRFEVIGS